MRHGILMRATLCWRGCCCCCLDRSPMDGEPVQDVGTIAFHKFKQFGGLLPLAALRTRGFCRARTLLRTLLCPSLDSSAWGWSWGWSRRWWLSPTCHELPENLQIGVEVEQMRVTSAYLCPIRIHCELLPANTSSNSFFCSSDLVVQIDRKLREGIC